jgi:DNA-binding transcriptional regulator YdaS (Cro superfamily)
MQTILEHWNSRFARFVKDFGVEALAARLAVRPSAIYHWIRGATTPRPVHAETIQRLARESGSSISMDDIYGHSREVRAGNVTAARACGNAAWQNLSDRRPAAPPSKVTASAGVARSVGR